MGIGNPFGVEFLRLIKFPISVDLFQREIVSAKTFDCAIASNLPCITRSRKSVFNHM